ncbi:MAG: IPT/TIG domain-containing protein [Patescibacteria group bacterium]
MKKITSSILVALSFLFLFSIASAQSDLPIITNISPSQGDSGTKVTIYGTNLSGVTSVEFYDSQGRYTGAISQSSVSANSVTFMGGLWAANSNPGTYQVGVTSIGCGGTCASNRLNFILIADISTNNQPTIIRISPDYGDEGTKVTISGTNLSGVTKIKFYNSQGFDTGSISPINVSANSVTFMGDLWAVNSLSGVYKVSVLAGTCQIGYGCAESNQVSFTLRLKMDQPAIISISPSQASEKDVNKEITIFGTNLSKVTSVEIYDTKGQIGSGGSAYPPSIITPSKVLSDRIEFVINGQLIASNQGLGTYEIFVVNKECPYTGCRSNRVNFTLNADNNTNNQPTITRPTQDQVPPVNNVKLTTPRVNQSNGQTNADEDEGSTSIGECVNLSNNLRYRSTDAKTNGEVSILQEFLRAEGYLNFNPIGFFGRVTLKAVKKFQSENNLKPTGFVGSFTRAKIKSLSCE